MTALAAVVFLSAMARGETLRLPMSPGAESAARHWVRPLVFDRTAQSGAYRLTGLSLERFEIRYQVGTTGQLKAAEVIAIFDPANRQIQYQLSVVDPAARQAAQNVLNVLKANLQSPGFDVQWPVGEPVNRAVDEDTVAGSWWQRLEPSLVMVLFWAMLLALLWALPGIVKAQGRVGTRQLVGLMTLGLALFFYLLLSDDVVLYHNGHAWNLVDLIVRVDVTDPHAGALAPLWSAVLGAAASAGHEPFLASRVGAVLAVIFCWLWIHAWSGRVRLAWLASALLAIQPVFHYVGRSEYVIAPGLALLFLAFWLATMAGRHRSLPILIAAGCAMGLMASFRALGPICWPVSVAMLFLAHPGKGAPSTRRLLLPVMIGALASVPAWFRITQVGRAYMPESGLSLFPELGRDQLLGDPTWSAPALALMAVIGALVLLFKSDHARGRWRPWLLLLSLGYLFGAIVFSTQHVAGTFLNTPRYHLWLLVPGCLGAAITLDALFRVSGQWRLVGLFTASIWLIIGLWTPLEMSWATHPEARQLHMWRAAIAQLPQGAILMVPGQRGSHQVALPFNELKADRPDIRLVNLHESTPTGERFIFKPLDCLRPVLEVAPGARDDCRIFKAGLRMDPIIVRRMAWMVPSKDGTGIVDGSTLGDYWVYPPLASPPGAIGLWRVAP
jgi:hypothetical protein